MDPHGIPAAELDDEDLEQQRAQAHATRKWALRRGTDEQFQRHSLRMLELEHEFLRRELRRQALDWRAVVDEATRLGNALRGLVVQMEARLDEYSVKATVASPEPPATTVAAAVAANMASGSWAPDGRERRLERASRYLPRRPTDDRADGGVDGERRPAHRAESSATGKAVAVPARRTWWWGGPHWGGSRRGAPV
jgi:hypothetical protein